MRGRSCAVIATGFVALDIIRPPFGQPVQLATGGSCGNVSANLASLGMPVQLIARLGQDDEGALVVDDLAAQGVGLNHVERSADVRTPVVIHEVFDRRSERDHQFLLNAPSGERLPRFTSITDDQAERVIRSEEHPRVLYFDRVSGPILRLADWAHHIGSLVFFEPADMPDPDLFASVLNYVDILKCSAERAREMRFAGRVHMHVPITVLTMGSSGLSLRLPTMDGQPNVIEMPAIPSTILVDSAGAGDAVSAALIRQIVLAGTYELPLRNILISGLRDGQRLAALNCEFVGARGAFRSLKSEAIRAVLDDNFGAVDFVAGGDP